MTATSSNQHSNKQVASHNHPEQTCQQCGCVNDTVRRVGLIDDNDDKCFTYWRANLCKKCEINITQSTRRMSHQTQ